MKSNYALGVLVAALAMAVASPSMAQKKKKGRVITLAEVTIVGRVQKPIAAVDVARIRPNIAMTEVRQSFVKLITDAIFKEPF